MNRKNIQMITVIALIGFVIGGIGPYIGIISEVGQAVICIITLPALVLGTVLLWKYQDGEDDYPFMGY
jgi:hypothetical protein